MYAINQKLLIYKQLKSIVVQFYAIIQWITIGIFAFIQNIPLYVKKCIWICEFIEYGLHFCNFFRYQEVLAYQVDIWKCVFSC